MTSNRGGWVIGGYKKVDAVFLTEIAEPSEGIFRPL
jgi:hypothetical protein